MIHSAGEPHPERDRLALALDVDRVEEALELAHALSPWFGVAKVGLELFTATGPSVVADLRARGLAVFVDLKLHDIPTTVRKAARVVGGLGARYLTLHTAGGVDMLRAGVEGFLDGAEAAGHPRPWPLGVTVLTSDGEAGPDVLAARASTLAAAGCPGAVCSALDVARVKALVPGVRAVCPGIRPAGANVHDQARVATPAQAIANGADVLVIGRSVTGALDPRAAAAGVAAEVLAAVALRKSGSDLE
jgi:orotidine-5'-phosphate decarboxylase